MFESSFSGGVPSIGVELNISELDIFCDCCEPSLLDLQDHLWYIVINVKWNFGS
jgi:hypothetical protein